MLDFNQYVQIFIAIFAIVSPFSAIPIFLATTASQTHIEKQKNINKTVLAVYITILVSIFLGNHILSFFNISINSFRVAGGILILLMAIHMINGSVPRAKHTPEENHEARNSEGDTSIVPLAIPLLVGPGSISTIIVYSEQGTNFYHYIALSLIGLLVSIMIWLTLKASLKIDNFLGITGINIISRIMGLILASVSIEFIALGLKNIFPILLH